MFTFYTSRRAGTVVLTASETGGAHCRSVKREESIPNSETGIAQKGPQSRYRECCCTRKSSSCRPVKREEGEQFLPASETGNIREAYTPLYTREAYTPLYTLGIP